MKLSAFFASIVLIPTIAFAMPGGVGSSLQKGLVGHWPLTGASEKVGENLVSNFTDPFAFTSFNYSAGVITATSTGPGWSGFQSTDSFPVVIGEKYRLTFDLTVSSGTASDLEFFIGSGAVGSSYVSPSRYSSIEGRNSVTFTATSNGTMRLSNQINEDMTFTMSNIQVRKIQTADTTPYDNHGTIYGATSATGPHGEVDGAMSFDGVDDYIDCGDLQDIANTFSISLWVKPTTYSSYNPLVFRDGNNTYNLGLRIDGSGNIEFRQYGGDEIRTDEGYPTQEWTHIVVTSNNLNGNIYVNGELKKSGTFSHSFVDSGNIRFGIYSYSSGFHFDGNMSDIRIYNRALTADEVAQLYNEGGKTTVIQKPSLETGLVGHWPLNGTSEAWTELTGDAWQNSTAYGRTTGIGYFSQTGNALEVTSTSGSWPGAGKMYAASEKGEYKVHIKANLNNGRLRPALHLYKNGSRVSYTAVQVPTSTVFSSNHPSGFNFGVQSSLGIYEATDIIDLTNAPDFDAIHIAILSEAGTASPYLEFQSTDIFLKQLVTADSTPYDNHGKLNGTSFATGPNGETNGSMSFDGVNDFVKLNTIKSGTFDKEITISQWVKIDTLRNYGGTFFSGVIFPVGNDNKGIKVYFNVSGNIAMIVADGIDRSTSGFSYVFNTDTWYHVLLTAKIGEYKKLYVNGAHQQSVDISNLTGNLNKDLLTEIGGPSDKFAGSIANTKVFNRVLSPEEITQLYEEKGKLMGNKVPSLKTGLVGHWPLSGGYTNTSVFADITPYDNGGIITGATVTTGVKGESGGAISFDGVDNYINGDGPIAINNSDFTMSMWEWNDEDSPNSWAGLIIGNNYTTGRLLTPNRFLTNDGGVVSVAIGAPVRTWNHIAAVHDLSEKKITTYLNGNIANTSTYTGDLSTTDQKFALGSRYQSNTSSTVFKGSMSDARVYNRALSDDEVKRLYELR